MSFNSILLVGCGNMGGAMLAGWLAGGIAARGFHRGRSDAASDAPAGRHAAA